MSNAPASQGRTDNEQNGTFPLRVAMIGAGIFATEAHAPVLKGSKEFRCVAIWSRRHESASALAKTFGMECAAYGGQVGLKTLLARSDVQAVIIALPIPVQPTYVLQALQAGKHVLSEKPIAASTIEARRVVEEYYGTCVPKGLVWCVAENFRYEPAWQSAADAVQNTIGEPLLLSLAMHAPFAPSNKYLQTEWRANPSRSGSNDAALFLDVFVHGAAGLRLVAGPPKTVSATLTSHAEHIPGFDTMAGHVKFVSGLQGVVSVTFCSSAGLMELVVTGTDGKVELKRVFGDSPGYRVTDGNGSISFHPFGGIEVEFQAFAERCIGAATSTANSAMKEESLLQHYNIPDEALADIAFVEAFIDSGKEEGAMKGVQYQSTLPEERERSTDNKSMF